MKFDELQLFHRDLPYAMPHWNAKDLDAGFGAADRQRIAALPDPGQRRIGCVYRITSPFRADAPMATSNSSTCGHPKLLQAGLSKYRWFRLFGLGHEAGGRALLLILS